MDGTTTVYSTDLQGNVHSPFRRLLARQQRSPPARLQSTREHHARSRRSTPPPASDRQLHHRPPASAPSAYIHRTTSCQLGWWTGPLWPLNTRASTVTACIPPACTPLSPPLTNISINSIVISCEFIASAMKRAQSANRKVVCVHWLCLWIM